MGNCEIDGCYRQAEIELGGDLDGEMSTIKVCKTCRNALRKGKAFESLHFRCYL